jgi:hypothetical protein
MHKIMLVLVAALSMSVAAGCKKKGGAGEAIAKMEEFQKAMCECKDKACADKVQEDMTKWGTEQAKTAAKDEKPDPELVKKTTDIMQKYSECMTKLMMADTEAKQPDEAKAPDVKPDEAKPDEAKPDEAKPDEAKPDEAKPDEAKADDKGGW